MRRKELEINDTSKIQEILDQCDVCRIGMLDGDRPYVVPMSFGYHYNNGIFEFYFHGNNAGKKVELLKQSNTVCLEFDTNCEIVGGENACSYSTFYQSVIAYGKPVFFADGEKAEGLNILMSQYSKRTDFTYPEKMLQSMAVYKVVVNEITAKEHKKPSAM